MSSCSNSSLLSFPSSLSQNGGPDGPSATTCPAQGQPLTGCTHRPNTRGHNLVCMFVDAFFFVLVGGKAHEALVQSVANRELPNMGIQLPHKTCTRKAFFGVLIALEMARATLK